MFARDVGSKADDRLPYFAWYRIFGRLDSTQYQGKFAEACAED